MSSKPTKSSCCAADPCTRTSGKDLLTWKDPVASAEIFVASTSLLLIYKYTDFVSWTFYLTTLLLSFTALAEYSGKLLTGEGLVTKFKPAQSTSIGDFLQAHASILASAFKDLEIKIQNLFTAVNIETTLKAALASYFLYFLTSLLSVWTILFASTVSAFSVPPIYLANKDTIDSSIKECSELAKEKSANAYKSVKAQAEPTLKKVQHAISPVTDYVKSKIPVRTAGSTVKTTIDEIPVAKPPKATEVSEEVPAAHVASAADIKSASTSEKEPLLN
ncbi:hypothetical protein FOA43_002406 [Brettanomyces nanus]|uniref:Reticulon-like protein n=1 Tax=Eeniella nana TaxID=13502 RepID=A0A875S0Z4_EENNA|nr:uncharacterized protein FOA43_002406 [Brettanomyces nanus]QPG75066.1 hypothetical protein FOA43_002406 [Brettanomyces nanus]